MKRLTAVALTSCLMLSLVVPAFAMPKAFAPDAVAAATETSTTPGTTYTKPKAEAPKTDAAKTTAAPAATGAVTYTVKDGDFFWKIAKWHGLTIEQLAKLNPQVKDISKLTIGQKLIVKAAVAAKPVTPAKPATPAVTAKPATPVTPATPAEPAKPVTPVVVPAKKLYMGMGSMNNFRARGTNYSFCITNANVIFDEDGKIVKAFVDVYEISQAKNFTNWPGATPEITVDTVTAQINGWLSKRDMGDAYGMAKAAITKKEWYQQMDFYQEFFVGKTVAELRTWFSKNTGATGKPINPATTKDEAELAKVASLTEPEKKVLVDVVAGATMSLSDNHSLIIEALEEAFKTRQEIKTN